MINVRMENLVKIYRNGKISVKALDNINLEIEKGEFLVFAGPSGSGKTTLLNIIGTMDRLTEGKLLIDGEDISGLTKDEASEFRKEKVGFIFQSFNLIPVLTAYENIEFSLDLMKKFGAKEKREKVESIMKEMGILELKNRRPAEMSGGQQQRVAVARALVKEPLLVLADEPTANLDSKTGGSILDLMEEMNEKKKITFIFSSHDPKIIERGKRVIRLKDGKIDKGKAL
ncbi:MAG: ABC transporter ATP-binding protein [Candidatus Delongbacteria bacterium]|nr:ABC transporter ATP-binding protein [Candidatus Delongbacteria bacterium]